MMDPIRVVLIEDDADLCEGWRELFTLMGYEIHCFQRATDALKTLDLVRKSHVLITDYYLPDMNGAELIRRLREQLPALPAILLTGSREGFVQDSVKGLRDCAILHKPLNIEDLELAIRKLIPA